MQQKKQSLNERARILAIQSLKEQARKKANPSTVHSDVRSQLVKKSPGIAMSDEAAKLFAEAIRGLLRS